MFTPTTLPSGPNVTVELPVPVGPSFLQNERTPLAVASFARAMASLKAVGSIAGFADGGGGTEGPRRATPAADPARAAA